jgi:hypothetical protein
MRFEDKDYVFPGGPRREEMPMMVAPVLPSHEPN